MCKKKLHVLLYLKEACLEVQLYLILILHCQICNVVNFCLDFITFVSMPIPTQQIHYGLNWFEDQIMREI